MKYSKTISFKTTKEQAEFLDSLPRQEKSEFIRNAIEIAKLTKEDGTMKKSSSQLIKESARQIGLIAKRGK